MKKVLFPALGLCFIFLVYTAPARAFDNSNTAAILDEYLSRLTAFGFSGSVLVEKDDQVIFRKGYGFANRRKRIPMTPDSPIPVASIAKQFTAASILTLVEKGKLSVNDSISKYLKGTPDDKESITIHHLLTHTSGFGNSYAGGGIFEREGAVKVLLERPLINPVGSKMVYSNDGYELLGAIFETVSGQNLQDFIRKEYFEPLGMNSAGFKGEGDFWGKDAVANAYNNFFDNGSPQHAKSDWDGYASGNLIISANDLFKWERSYRKDEILTAEVKKKMFTPYADYPNGWKYGYGWFVINTEPGKTEFYHGGGDIPRGYTASYNRYPDSKSTVIILTNSMTDEIGFLNVVKPVIMKIVFGDEFKMPPAANAELKQDIEPGIFTSANGETFALIEIYDRLLIGAVGQKGVNFLASPEPASIDKLKSLNGLSSDFLDRITVDTSGTLPFQPALEALEKKLGKYKNKEMLGTHQVTEDRESWTTYARLIFKNGSEVVRFVRNGDNAPYPLTGTPYPALTPLVFKGHGELLAYYPVSQKSVQIKLVLDKNRDVIGINLNNGTAKLFARKD